MTAEVPFEVPQEVGDPHLLHAPVQSLSLSHTTSGASGTGAASLDAPVQSLETGTPTASVVGEFTLDAPVQSLEVGHPEATISGVFTLDAPVQSLEAGHESALIGWADWVLDGDAVATPTDEIATHRLVSLSLRADTSLVTDVLRSLRSDEGKLDVRTYDDGGYTAVDRADGDNTFDVTPPVTRLPLRQEGEYHVARYEESLVSQDVGEWDVTVDLQHATNRTDSPSIDESRDADEWSFETRYGTIATDRVSAEVAGTGEDGVERVELEATLTFEQAHVFEAAMARLDAVRVKRVADSTNEPRDDSPDDGNTLDVTPPDDAPDDVVSAGEHVVMGEFESRRLNDSWQRVSFEVAPVG